MVRLHWVMIVMGGLLAFLVIAPAALFPAFAGSGYQEINIPHFGTDAHFYLSRGKEVMEGHSLGNPLLREGKNEQDSFFMINEQVLLAPVLFFGLSDRVSVSSVYQIYTFFGVFVFLIILYVLLLQLTTDRLLATATSLFVVGGYSIVYNKTLFYTDFNIYGRPMFPCIAAVPTALFFLFFVKSLKTRSIYYAVLSGITFGIVCYVYFFSWTFITAFLGSFGFLAMVSRRWEWVRNTAITSGAGILIGGYNLYRLLQYIQSDIGKQLSYFHWLVHTHQPIFSKIGFLVALLWLFFWYKKRVNNLHIFFGACVLAGWVVLNQQIVTGKLLQYGHYYWYFIVPYSIVISSPMVYELFLSRWSERVRQVIYIAVLCMVFVNTSVGQYLSFQTVWSDKISEQRYRPVIDVLKQMPDGVVLAADNRDQLLFTIYTRHDLFWSISATLGSITVDRPADSLAVYLFLRHGADSMGATLKQVIDGDKTNFYRVLYETIEGYSSGFDYYVYRGILDTDMSRMYPHRQETIRKFVDKYGASPESWKKKTLELLKFYGVRYIVWDEAAQPEWDLSFIPGLTPIFEQDTIHLYRVNF